VLKYVLNAAYAEVMAGIRLKYPINQLQSSLVVVVIKHILLHQQR
jgi:hypothetical protein